MAFHRGQWVVWKGKPAIVVGAGTNGKVALHLVDPAGETVMERDKLTGRLRDAVPVADEADIREAEDADIPAPRRRGVADGIADAAPSLGDVTVLHRRQGPFQRLRKA